MNSTDIIGYAKDGALYCPAHKPTGEEVNPVFLDDGQKGDSCDQCGEMLEGCEYVPHQTWKINGFRYDVCEQQEGQYAVKRTGGEEGRIWLTSPERHYETEAGCHYAILLDLEDPA